MSKSFSESFSSLKRIIDSRNERSANTKKQIIGLIILRGATIPIQMLLISISINFIGTLNYGIWLTLSTIIGWINFFDIGFGNGLRNKFGEAKAYGKHELARCYVSTTYAGLILILICISIIFFSINPFLDWTSILNTPKNMAADLNMLVIFVYLLFCLQFILQLINTLFLADQKPVRSSFFNLLGNICMLIIFYILSKVVEGKIIYLAIVLTGIPVIILFITSLWFYGRGYKRYRPSFKYFRKELIGDLMGLGIKFFVIQIGSLVLFQLGNILIAQLYGPSEVTPYNIAFKYFGFIIMLFSLINTPFWSAFTDAFVKREMDWIKMAFMKLIKIWLVFACGSILLLIFCRFIFKIWVPMIHISSLLAIVNCLYAIILTWNAIFFSFINGIGKVKLQFYLYIFIMVFFIPVTFLLAKYFGLHSAGIILTMTVCQFIFSILMPIQCYKILHNKAYGIWNA